MLSVIKRNPEVSMNKNICSAGLSGSTLKLIAIITMFIDHTGATVIRAVLRLPSVANDAALREIWASIYTLSRNIGRLAFPIFCFLLVEGFFHTRSVRKYAQRLFLFSLLSEIPFDIALKGSWFFPEKQNVYFTLLAGLLVMIGLSCVERLVGKMTKLSVITCTLLRILLAIPVIAAGMYLADVLDTDYNYKGVLLIAILYLLHQNRLSQCAAGAAAVAWELPAPLAFLPVYLYNGKRGLQMKYVFYWFYPVHLMLLYGITAYVIPLL